MDSDLNDRDDPGLKVITDEISEIRNLIERAEPKEEMSKEASKGSLKAQIKEEKRQIKQTQRVLQ